MTNTSYPPLLGHILDGNEFGPMLASPDLEQYRKLWRELFRELIASPPTGPTISNVFHTQWHTSHHRIRELVDDDHLIMDMLWVWLPCYEGKSMILYRGENIDRFESGVIGTAWTDQEATARMFASGLNALGRGGVVLQTNAPADAIIAGPSAHSRYLNENEFTVDTRRLGGIVQIRTFTPSGLAP